MNQKNESLERLKKIYANSILNPNMSMEDLKQRNISQYQKENEYMRKNPQKGAYYFKPNMGK